jgi:hypothetical protein
MQFIWYNRIFSLWVEAFPRLGFKLRECCRSLHALQVMLLFCSHGIEIVG